MKPAPLLALGKTASPKGIKQDTTEPLYFYSHPVFWHFPEGQGRDRVGKRLRQEGEGGPHFPQIPPCPTTRGAHTTGEGRHRSPLLWKRLHKAIPTPHKRARSTLGQQDHREAERCGVKGRKATVSLQTGSRPLPFPFLLHPQSLQSAPPTSLGHSLIASSFFPAAGDTKRKRVREQGG